MIPQKTKFNIECLLTKNNARVQRIRIKFAVFVLLLHPTVCCLLSTVYCLLSTVYCLLSTVYCLLSTVYCLLSSVATCRVQCLLGSTVATCGPLPPGLCHRYRTLRSLTHDTVGTVLIHNIKCAVHCCVHCAAHCTWCIVYCILCSVLPAHCRLPLALQLSVMHV